MFPKITHQKRRETLKKYDLQSTIYALDFDGVLCDSVIETAITAWRLAQNIWQDMPKIEASQKSIDDFREIRPFLETGYEAILIMRLLYLGVSIDRLCDNYKIEIQKLIDQEGLDIEVLKKLFGEARDRWIANSLEEWVAMNPLFDGVVEFLNSLERENLYIVTTKQERFVKYILEANGIELEDDKIWGLDKGMTKADILFDIQSNNPNKKILFVEDRYPALVTVIEDNRLDGVMLQLASWGYNTPLDKQKAMQSERIELIVSFKKVDKSCKIK